MATHVVTGAFSYTGKYITRLLLAEGHTVRTLTGHPRPGDPLSKNVETFPLDFSDRDGLTRVLRGADTLFNTYWVRFPKGKTTFERAVENSRTLIGAAAAAARRLVHVSITNANSQSPLPYFRGKGLVEEAIADSGLSYAILRPTVIFGVEDILLNNIAWSVRRFPIMPIPGDGAYELQPIFVEDLAALAVEAVAGEDRAVMDAVGPERYSYRDLVRLIADAVGVRPRLLKLPADVALGMSRRLGMLLRDTMLTRDEVKGLTAGLLVSGEPPRGRTSLREWARGNADLLGRTYASEVARHYR
ncbi:MAG: NAD(P)H-binding protein [Chloroflexi bacterium]|nr:NAD(P)H-binding protein [Chloroflexota bacterium]